MERNLDGVGSKANQHRLFFRCRLMILSCSHLTFRARTLIELGKAADVCLVLNNVAIGFIRVTPNWSNYQVAIPIGALSVKNRLQIYSSDSGSPANDRRELSVAVVSIKLS